MAISVKLTGTEAADRVTAKMHAAVTGLPDDIRKAAIVFGFRSVARSVKDYLSGPRPDRLGVVTGRLRSSIASRVDGPADKLEVVVGTKVRYAAIHERGFTGTEQVQAHNRASSKIFGKTVEPFVVHVGAHSRKVTMRARPFLSTAVRDELPTFEESIRQIMKNAVSMGA